jgi:hypothetical protein
VRPLISPADDRKAIAADVRRPDRLIKKSKS